MLWESAHMFGTRGYRNVLWTKMPIKSLLKQNKAAERADTMARQSNVITSLGLRGV